MNSTSLPEANELAVAVIDDLSSGHWSRVSEQVDPAVRDQLSEDILAAAWNQIIGLAGAYRGHGEPESTRVGDVTISDTPLFFLAGDFKARISFLDDRRIVGLFILTSESG